MLTMVDVRWRALAACLWLQTIAGVAGVAAQPVCNDVGGLVEVDQQMVSGPPAINDAGLLAYVEFHDFAFARYVRIGNGESVVRNGPYLPALLGGNFQVYDLNADDTFLVGQIRGYIEWPTGEDVAAIGARFTVVGIPRLNDHGQVVFLGEERLPDDSTAQGVYLAAFGTEPVRVPVPNGYHWNTLSGGADAWERPPGIDNDGMIAVVARRESDGAFVVLSGTEAGLTEVVSGWNGRRFWEVQSFFMVRDPLAGPVFSFIARTMDAAGNPDADGVYRLHRFANGQLEVAVDSTAFGAPVFVGGVVNELGDFAVLWYSPLTIAYGRHGGAPATILAAGQDYPLAPANQVYSASDLRINGSGQLAFNVSIHPNGSPPTFDTRQLRYDPPGTTQCSPVLPGPCDQAEPNLNCFREIRNCNLMLFGGWLPGCWVDPPVARGYEYTMLGDAHFTAITGFPTGFAAPFRVIADGVELPGTYGPGDQVQFTPPGVKTFTVTGIEPGVDPARSDGFPLRIVTDRDAVDFDMRALVDRVDVGVGATALSLVDQTPVGRGAKLKFTARDIGLTKGIGAALDGVSATFTVAYEGAGTSGRFSVPAGASDGRTGWTENDATRASFANRDAPAGTTQVKTLRIQAGKSAKLVASGRGDDPLDIVGAGAPPARVLTALCVENGAEPICQCSAFSACIHRPSSAGAKLTCKNGVADPACGALP